MSKEHQPLSQINEKLPSVSLGLHNVGAEGVLRHSSEKTQQYIEKYVPRGVDHTLYTPGAAHGIIVEKKTPEILDHAAQMSTLIGEPIQILTLDEVPKDTLTSPYINTPETHQQLSSNNIKVWGLDPNMVAFLKDKELSNQSMAELLPENGCIRVPEHTACSLNELADTGLQFLTQEVLVSNNPTPGLVIRFKESDGGYGNVVLEQIGNSVLLTPNGDLGNIQIFTGQNMWQDALFEAKNELAQTINSSIEQKRVVVSRLIDEEDSPGLSVIIVEGQIFSLGWNGQYQEGNSKACVGTHSYDPKNNPDLVKAQEIFEAQSIENFESYLRAVATQQNIDFNTITAIVNIDFLIPSEKERAFLRSKGRRDNIIYGLEINPRWTNRSAALGLVALIEGLGHTVYGLNEAANRNVLAIDSESIGNGATIKEIRKKILTLDEKNRYHGNRVILRMPPSEPNSNKRTAGMVYVGDVDRLRRETQILFQS